MGRLRLCTANPRGDVHREFSSATPAHHQWHTHPNTHTLIHTHTRSLIRNIRCSVVMGVTAWWCMRQYLATVVVARELEVKMASAYPAD